MRKWIIRFLIVVVIIAAGWFVLQGIQGSQSPQASMYETAALQRGELTAYVGTTGTVRANQTATLAWQITGRIGEINVAVGDKVDKDFVLARLSHDSLPQSVIQAEADLIEAENDLENLRVSKVAQAQAQQALAKAQDELEDAQNRLESKQYQRASTATIDSARANYILAQDAVKRAEKTYSKFADLEEDNVIRAQALASLSAARQERDKALENLNWLLSRPDAIELAEAEANLAVAQANLEEAQREWERLKNGPDPDDIRAAELRVAADQNIIDSTILKAPFAGTITRVESLEGDLVSPGEVSFRIDDLSRLLVDVEVPEVDINQIQVGQITKITFDAIQERGYAGKVTEVARVGTTGTDGVDFEVSIQLLDEDEQVLPGMTAAVNIITNQLSDALLVPNRAVRLKGSSRVIYVLRNGALTMVEIELGAVSDTYSEIVAGDVKEGDLVVLNPPSISQLNSMFMMQ